MAIAEIIKYEGDNTSYIWKSPLEDFNCLTQLIVPEFAEAIFMMNGQALDSFGPGRYTLETQNIPLLSKLINNIIHDGKTPFHCQVYFINKTVQTNIKWGTDSKVRYLDQDSGIPIEIGASGQMNIQVADGRKLLIKLVGMGSGITWYAEDNKNHFAKSLQDSLRPLLSTIVKANLATAIKQENMDILEVDEHLEPLSNNMRTKISPYMEEYGLEIIQFYISTVVLPEEDRNFQRLRELHVKSFDEKMIKAEAQVEIARSLAEADKKVAERKNIIEAQQTQTEIAKKEAERNVIEAQAEAEQVRLSGLAEAEVMRAKGYNQKDVLQAEVQKAYAEGIGNMGGSGNAGGSAMSDIIGLGVGLKAAGAFGNQMSDLFNTNQNGQNSSQSVSAVCSKCGSLISAGTKFCPECGTPVSANNEIICPNCGKKVFKGKFCPECGAKIEG